jgi:hypothetical protein
MAKRSAARPVEGLGDGRPVSAAPSVPRESYYHIHSPAKSRELKSRGEITGKNFLEYLRQSNAVPDPLALLVGEWLSLSYKLARNGGLNTTEQSNFDSLTVRLGALILRRFPTLDLSPLQEFAADDPARPRSAEYRTALHREARKVVEMMAHALIGEPSLTSLGCLPDDTAAVPRVPVVTFEPAAGKPEESPPCPVVLRGENESPLINNVEKPILTPNQYRVVKALVIAFPARISGDSLARKSNTEAPIKIMDRLRRDPDWERVLSKPGHAHGGYAIVSKSRKVIKSRETRRGKSNAG